MSTLRGRLSEHFRIYESHLMAEGKARGTLEFYRDLRRVIAELGDPDVSRLTRNHIREWLKLRQARALKLAEIKGREVNGPNADWRRLRAFLNWLVSEGFLPAGFTDKFSVTKTAPPIDSLSDAEVQALVNAARSRPWRMRDEALVRLWLDTGLRPSEMNNLTLASLKPDQRLVLVTASKTRDLRLVPYGTKSTIALQ